MLTRRQRATAAAADRGESHNNSNNPVFMGENNENLNDDLEETVAAEEHQNGSGDDDEDDGEDDNSDRGSVGDGEEDDDDDHEFNVDFFGPFERGGGTLADHMRLARYMYPDEADFEYQTEVDINFDEIVDHPYLQEHYPERRLTMRDVMTYEYNFLRNQQNYDDALEYKNGRVSTIVGISNIHSDIAILDRLEDVHFVRCTPLPENIKYLTNLRKLSFIDCMRSIASPPGVLETMRGVRCLYFQGSTLDILNDFVNLPAVDSVEILSGLTRYGYESAGLQLVGLSTSLRRLRRRGNNRSIFRNNMRTLTFSNFRLSDTQLSEVLIEVIMTFPHMTSISLSSALGVCRFSPRAVAILAMDLRKRIKNDKHFATKMEKFDLTRSCIFKSKEGLLAVIELLNVMDSITHVGDWLYLIYSYDSDDSFSSLDTESRLAIYRERTAELNDPEWKRLRLKIITMLNQVYQRRYLKGFNNASGGHQAARCSPLSIWSHAIQKASIMRPRFKIKDATLRFEESEKIDDELPAPSPWNEATEEVKMWRASTVYLLLREGLTASDDWHERRNSAKPHHGRKRKTRS
mmetsp:Transcript_9777/g.23926  ORF Transcript_9777/g.23926 Transcript_9777/m.23926 type:complete len:576 (-) Transcript_9777:30-1757(-)